MTKDQLRKKAMELPLNPGVYIMKNAKGDIIYIGKAKALKNRVSQYFGKGTYHTEKVRQMVENVFDFEYILCASEYEALMLECSLIKQHSPKYNILLKDDKGFHYIKITPAPYPLLKAAMQKEDDGATYIGPFYSHYAVRTAVDAATRAFKLPRCSKSGKEMGKKKGRPCLNFHIGLCSAPCVSKISKSEYENNVELAVKFITEGSSATVAKLTKEMQKLSQEMQFEKAAVIRDSIKAIKDINEKQRVVIKGMDSTDLIAFAFTNNKASAEVFSFREGKLFDREQFLLDITDRDSLRRQFITGFYSLNREIPKRIAVDQAFEDFEVVEQFLNEKSSRKVELFVPQKGEHKRLIETVKQNANEYLSEKTSRHSHSVAKLDELASLLGLERVPEYIESYDISHTGGRDTVGAMVVFKDGVAYKSGYRKFKLEDYKNDDYACTREVISRRFKEYEKGEDEYFSTLPDLILLDGGIGQYNAVKDIVPKGVALFAMVKNDSHKTRALISDKGEIALSQTGGAYRLVYSIQEEVHRFAIGYHKQKRKKKMLGSSLSVIEGLGQTRIKNLLLHFGTVDNVANAEIEQLLAVKTITKPVAQKIYDYFHGEKNG